MALDYGKLLMDDEINLNIEHVLKGFEVNEETLSVTLIKEVGDAGNFLTHPSTFEYFRDAMSPQLVNRESHEQWISNGGTSLHERALDKAKSIVENYHPPPISSQAQKEIEEIIQETEKELKVDF